MIVAGVLTLWSATAAGQSGHGNAATHYQRAIDVAESLTSDEHNTFWDYYGPAFTPSQELRDALRKAQPALNHFNRGSLQGYAHFNVDAHSSFDLPTSHLIEMRRMAIATRADVNVRLHDGDTRGAADRIAAMNRSLIHYQDDRMLVSSLVGVAICTFTDNMIETGLDHAAFDPGDVMNMLHPLEQLMAGDDPFGFVESLAVEQERTVSLLHDAGDVEALNSMLVNIWSESDTLDLDRIDAMSNDELLLHVDAYDTAMDEIIDVFAMNDHEAASARLADIEATFLESEHNLLAPLITIYGKAMQSRNLGESTVRNRISALRELLDDDFDAMELANAAVWYLRGVAILNKLDDDTLASLREMDLFWDGKIPDPVMELLRGPGAQVIEYLETGSNIRRCDFSIARVWIDHPPIPHYTPAMRDAFRLLHADAIRLMHADDPDASAQRLASCYRVINHLSGDSQMLSSLLAHAAYEHTHLLVDTGLHDESWSPELIKHITTAFNRLSRADPFGYGRAASAMRDMAGKLHRYFSVSWIRNGEDATEKIESLHSMTLDEVLSLLQLHVVLDDHWRDKLAREGEWVPPKYSPEFSTDALRDVISLGQYEALHKQAAAISNEILTDAFDPTDFPQLIVFTDLTTRRQQARSVLHIGAAMFQMSETASGANGYSEGDRSRE